jgi:hypothetical protein
MRGSTVGEKEREKRRLDPVVYNSPMHAMHEKSTMQLLDAAAAPFCLALSSLFSTLTSKRFGYDCAEGCTFDYAPLIDMKAAVPCVIVQIACGCGASCATSS